MGYLQEIFPKYNSGRNGTGKDFYKHEIYAKIYEEWLDRYIGKEVLLVELGTGKGGSLQVWKDYLGEKATIYGIDYSSGLFYEEERITHFLADQYKKETLEQLPIKNIDVFIDDGSHVSSATITTFEVMFPRVKSGGLYFIEDVGTSYRKDYGGGYRKHGSLIEYCKDIFDVLQKNEWGELIPAKINMQEISGHLLPNNPLFSQVEMLVGYNGIIIMRKK